MTMILRKGWYLIVGLWLTLGLLCPDLSGAQLREEMGLAALWTLDQATIQGNEIEDTFAEYHGTITGKPESVPGAVGEGLKFDGAIDLIRMIDDIFFPSVSVEAIIRPTLGTRNPIYDKYNYGIQLTESDYVGIWIRADTNNEAKQWPSAYTPFPTDGDWHHVVGVAEDQKEVRIYLDGVLKQKTPTPDPISIAYGAAVKPSIAYTQHLGGIWYEGSIDEVAVYEGALTDIDVKRLYADSLAVSATGKLASLWASMKRSM